MAAMANEWEIRKKNQNKEQFLGYNLQISHSEAVFPEVK